MNRLACLVLLGLLGGCSTAGPPAAAPAAPDQNPRRTALWAVATECADRQKGALRIDRVDDDGQVHVTVIQGGQPDVPAFTACYKEKAPATLAAAERVASPAQIVERGTRSTSIAIQTIGNRFLVPVVLNGQRATFLLDTGANITVVSPQLARRAGVELLTGAGTSKSRARMASGQEVEVSLVRLKSVMVGLARIDNLQVAVYEIGVLDSTANPPLVVDGFLGADFLSRFTMTIDAQGGKLLLQLADVPAR